MGANTPHTVELVSAGVDWLTMTMRHDNDKRDTWLMAAMHELNAVSKQGYQLKERHLLGYNGYSAGNCFVGLREDTRMAQFTGFHANDAFSSIYEGRANISRIDLQVTVRYDVMPSDVARKAYEGAACANGRLSSERRRKLYIIMGSDGGDTLYCGAASSTQRGRLYNKEVQSEDARYTRTWRYEVVYRDVRAKSVAAIIPRGIGDRAPKVRDIVATWWGDRGVDCTHFSGGTRATVPLFRTLPTEIEAKLEWLRKQVRPTVQSLIELGMADEVSEALNIVLAPSVSYDTERQAE